MTGRRRGRARPAAVAGLCLAGGLVVAAAGCGARPVAAVASPPAGAGTSAWPTFQGTSGRDTVAATSGGAATLAASWRFATQGSLTVAPAVVHGVAYLTSMDDHVYAVDVATGQRLWSFKANNQIMSEALVVDGRVFFGSGNKGFTVTGGTRVRGTGPSAVYALDASDGHLLWAEPVDGEAMPTPAYSHGVVYEPTGSGRFYAFDALTGRLLWSLDVGSIASMSSPAIVGNVAVFGGTGGNRPPSFFGVNLSTHRVAWSVPFPAAWGGPDDLSPTAAGGAVYVQVPYGSTSIEVGQMAIDAQTGRVLWQRILGTGPANFHGGEEAGVATAVGGVIYVGSPVLNGLWALDAQTGHTLWTSPLRAPVRVAPTVAGGRIFVEANAGTLYVLRQSDGAVLGSLTIGHRPVETDADYVDIPCTTPAVTIVGDTALAAGGDQNTLVAIPLSHLPGA